MYRPHACGMAWAHRKVELSKFGGKKVKNVLSVAFWRPIGVLDLSTYIGLSIAYCNNQGFNGAVGAAAAQFNGNCTVD